jgi:hypothetical protein
MYDSTMLSPSVSHPLFSGTDGSEPTASIAAEMSASAGGTICDPSPR